VQVIRESLSLRLNHPGPPQRQTAGPKDPPVEELLEIDRIYRERAAKGRLVTVAPRRFNPTGEAWLPVLRIKRRGRRYCAYYANTARSHQLDHLHDWVVIYCLDKAAFGRWTVITSTYGTLRGRRNVRGREAECKTHYGESAPVQLSLLPLSQAIG
jgi:putative hydrolase